MTEKPKKTRTYSLGKPCDPKINKGHIWYCTGHCQNCDGELRE